MEFNICFDHSMYYHHYYCRYHKQTRVPWQDNIQTTVAASATAVNVILSATHSERVECGSVTTDSDTADTSMSIESPSVSGYQAPPRSLPLIVSACPGWVCYAEKTNPQTLPYLSSTKSPQQILGVLVRRLFATVLCSGFDTSLPAVDELLQNFIESHAQKIVFVSIQPCFDKKLEGSRLVSIC